MIKKLSLILCLILSGKTFAINYVIEPNSIIKQANENTWAVVLNDIFNDQTAANMVLLAIDSGQQDWLDLALIMLKKSNNARTQKMLVMSLGEALQWQPKRVLTQVSKYVPISNLCSVEGVYEWRLMSKFLAVEALTRRLNAVQTLNDFKQAKLKQQCINALQSGLKTVNQQLSNTP